MTSSLVSSVGGTSDPTERAGEAAAQRIWMRLEEGRQRTGFSRSAFFDQALRVWDAFLHPIDLDTYLNTICVGIEAAMPQITQALDELQREAVAHYLDVLGLVYMRAGIRANAGEEYTPWSLVRLLVRLLMIDFVPPTPGDPPLTVYDPCCGSGTLLLGQMEYLDGMYPEVLDRNQVQFFGQDASYEAWLMARINLRIHLLGRHIRQNRGMRQANQRQEPEVSTEQEKTSPASSGASSPTLSLAPTPPLVVQVHASALPDELSPLFTRPSRETSHTREQIVQPELPGFSSP